MSIHDDGNGSSDSCSSTSGTLHAVNGFSDDFESKFDVALHQDTKGFILEPGRRAKVRIRFAPETVYNDFRQCKCEIIMMQIRVQQTSLDKQKFTRPSFSIHRYPGEEQLNRYRACNVCW